MRQGLRVPADRYRKVAPRVEVSVVTCGFPGGMAIRPTLPESPGCPARWKVRPPSAEVKTSLGLTPGCGSDGLVQSSATLAGDAAATAVASGASGGQLNDSLDQCLPPSVDV